MRKLLLATAAALGVSMGASGYADAQVVYSSDNTGTVASNSQGYGSQASDAGQSFPTPGTVTVRLNGRFRFYVGAVAADSTRTNFTSSPSASASTSISTATTNTPSAGYNKNSNYGIIEYARLYPGFDGVAANGLKYGASLELRQDNPAAAGGGVYGSPSGQDQRQGVFYLRREWGYIGSDKLGTLRLGASDPVTSLFLTGTFETFDDGGLDGDIPAYLPGSAQLNFPFADQGSLYSTDKIVYVTPQFYGFDGGVDWEPNTSAVGTPACSPTAGFGQFASSGQGAAAAGCPFLSSTSTNDVARRRNTYDALVRYRGTFGPLGIAATASYTGSSRVLDSGIQGSSVNPKHFPLEDLSVGDFGLVLTYGGFSVGGNYQIGRYNSTGSGYGTLVARGQPNAQAAIIGATYTFGPVIFGAHYLWSWSEGDQQTATGFSPVNNTVREVFNSTTGLVAGGQRFETGAAAGATYSLAPGVALYLSYIWEQRRQNGYNFITGASNNPNHNKTDGNVIAVGSSFAW